MNKDYLLLSILMFPICNALSQDIHLGSWNIVNVKFNIDGNLSVFAEGQIRSLQYYNNFHYYEFKGGINFKAGKNIGLILGAGSYQTYHEGGDFVLPKNNNEFRIWPQLTLFQNIGKMKVEQRYRTEFRLTSYGYRNRFRYRLALAYPFGKEKNNFKPFQISAGNELFFTDREPYFERNRALAAFNYKPSASTTIQIGYLHQFDYKINDETGRDFFQFGFFIELFGRQTTDQKKEVDLKGDS